MQQVELVRNLAGSFDQNRIVVARKLRELRERDPHGFADAAIHTLRDDVEGAGSRFLLSTLMTQPDGLQIIFNPSAFSAEQSGQILAHARHLDPQIEVKLARLLASMPIHGEEQVNFSTRVLDVLGRFGEPATVLPALRQLLQCSNGRVRSKAALLMGRVSRNPQWARMNDSQQDHRVVSNAIESLWGLDSEAAKVAFREATEDPNNRAAGNGAVGLFLAHDFEGILVMFRFAKNGDPSFRATAAWCMGRTGDPRFLQCLEVLGEDSDAAVRRMAARGEIQVRERMAELKNAAPVPVQIRAPKYTRSEHSFHVMIADGGVQTRGLTPFHFVVWNGGQVVESFTSEEVLQSSPVHYHVRFAGPLLPSREVKIDLYAPLGVGSDAGLELVF